MAHSSRKVLMQLMVAALLFAMLGGSLAFVICKVDTNKLKNSCQKFATGDNPPPPDQICCNVLRRADLPCLCSYKSALPSLGINAAKALALPGQCGLRTPSKC
ncbi:MtN5 protein [Trifolium medium]|uniref:MtN5 protein n=1 Tax=Trifolium medium TaxID=97028 RepID=A0A392QP75_9FABA|nr:MtN5 protein [Trifolium medium]